MTVNVIMDVHLLLVVTCLLQAVTLCRGDKVHCYCNSPRCVGYSYMCVSEYGCFSQLTTDSSYLRGCVEDLVMIERCLKAEEDTYKRLNKSLTKADDTIDLGIPILSCCYDDMCNYANYDPVDQRGALDHDDYANQEMTSLSSKAVWFRAAVIAVPVAGVCILILLAMLASRLLGNDSNKQSFSHLNNYRPNYTQKRTHNPSSLHGQPFVQQKRTLYFNSRNPAAMGENYMHNEENVQNNLPGDIVQETLRYPMRYGEHEGLLSSNHGTLEANFGMPKCHNDSHFFPHQHIKASQFYPVRTEKLQIV